MILSDGIAFTWPSAKYRKYFQPATTMKKKTTKNILLTLNLTKTTEGRECSKNAKKFFHGYALHPSLQTEGQVEKMADDWRQKRPVEVFYG